MGEHGERIVVERQPVLAIELIYAHAGVARAGRKLIEDLVALAVWRQVNVAVLNVLAVDTHADDGLLLAV